MARKYNTEFEAHQRAVYRAGMPSSEFSPAPDIVVEKGGNEGDQREKGTVSQGARVGSFFNTRPINGRDFHYTETLDYPEPA